MKYRMALIVPTYLLLFFVCYLTAYCLRFEFSIPEKQMAVFWSTITIVLGLKCICCLATGEWKRSFRYASLHDILWIVISSSLVAVSLVLADAVGFFNPIIPRSIILIDVTLVILSSGLLRSGTRLYNEIVRPAFGTDQREPTLILGVDDEAISLLRALQTSATGHRVVGLLDDRGLGRKSLVAGLPVYKMRKNGRNLPKLVRRSQAMHLLVPASVPGRTVRDLLPNSAIAGLKVHVIPAVDELVAGRFKLAARDVTISDLLRREPNHLDMQSISEYITGKCVLVTGAAGSIGSELCRQILNFEPKSLVLVDQSELGMFTIGQEFSNRNKDADNTQIYYTTADICDSNVMERVMLKHQPHLMFHAAAYKHVPLMEENPQAAIANNVFGTKTIVDVANRCGVDKFVMISTDKAVNPTSVMGSTKLVGEKYLQGVATHSNTEFITVRFGNVLDSAGSVVPTFRKQIESGGPITVTHPEMERFFMTIPEAVQLVLQAGAIGNSGEILILEMGAPVKILDLAKDMILLSGLQYPQDIDIAFTGLRPGEKMFEELFYNTERNASRVHEKIFQAARPAVPLSTVEQSVNRLKSAVNASRDEAIHILRHEVMLLTQNDVDNSSVRKAA